MDTRLIAIAVGTLLAASLIPHASAQADDEDPVLALGSDGVEMMTEAEFDELDAQTSETCHGTAPFEYYCSTGRYVFDSFPLGVGCGAEEGYTGVVEVRLTHEGPDLHVFCVFEDGKLDQWDWYCCFPAFGEAYQHEGYSYTYTPWEERGFGISDPGRALYEPTRTAFGLAFDGEPLGPPGGHGDWSSEVRP